MQNQITTGQISLLNYLPPNEVLWEWATGAVVAFVIVQVMKTRRRLKVKDPECNVPRYTDTEITMITFTVTFISVLANLLGLHEYPAGRALLYSLQGAVLSPIVITAMLYTLGVFAPGLRAKLKQDRRASEPDEPRVCTGRRDDDTTRFL